MRDVNNSRYQASDYRGFGKMLATQTNPLDKVGAAYHIHLEFTNGDKLTVAPTSWNDHIMIADAVEGEFRKDPIRNMLIHFQDIRTAWVEEFP